MKMVSQLVIYLQNFTPISKWHKGECFKFSNVFTFFPIFMVFILQERQWLLWQFDVQKPNPTTEKNKINKYLFFYIFFVHKTLSYDSCFFRNQEWVLNQNTIIRLMFVSRGFHITVVFSFSSWSTTSTK